MKCVESFRVLRVDVSIEINQQTDHRAITSERRIKDRSETIVIRPVYPLIECHSLSAW